MVFKKSMTSTTTASFCSPDQYTFSHDIICIDVYKFFDSYNEMIADLSTTSPNLSFPFTTLSSDCRLCVLYICIQDLATEHFMSYYNYIAKRENILQTSVSSSITDTFPAARLFYQYCESTKRVAVVHRRSMRICISLSQYPSNKTGCFCCPPMLLRHLRSQNSRP